MNALCQTPFPSFIDALAKAVVYVINMGDPISLLGHSSHLYEMYWVFSHVDPEAERLVLLIASSRSGCLPALRTGNSDAHRPKTKMENSIVHVCILP